MDNPENKIDLEKLVEDKYAQVCEGDYFSILDLNPDTSSEAVDASYKRLRQLLNPDHLPADLAQRYTEKLKEIGEVLEEAWIALKNDKIRLAYREAYK